MKILVVSDEESRALWDFYTPDKLEGVELILACGDLKAEYLEFLVTMTNLPLFYVAGNHDKKYVQYPPEGCVCIDDKVVSYKGVRILGLGGCMRYKEGPYMYTENQMRYRIRKISGRILKYRGIDILLTHAAARGYGDMNDLPHLGFECFNSLLYSVKPAYMLHGHVHSSYRAGRFQRIMKHPSGTTIINCFEKYIFEFDETQRSKVPFGELCRNLFKLNPGLQPKTAGHASPNSEAGPKADIKAKEPKKAVKTEQPKTDKK